VRGLPGRRGGHLRGRRAAALRGWFNISRGRGNLGRVAAFHRAARPGTGRGEAGLDRADRPPLVAHDEQQQDRGHHEQGQRRGDPGLADLVQ
jgi:hypothetical protein